MAEANPSNIQPQSSVELQQNSSKLNSPVAGERTPVPDPIAPNSSSTQEGEAFSPVQYAGIVARGCAYILDLIMIVFLVAPMAVLSGQESSTGYSTLSFIIFLIYATITEAKWGQTLGKKVLKIKVTMVNGEPCSFKGAALRNLGLILDTVLSGHLLAILLIIFTSKKQRIGDFIGRTVVVKS